MYYRQTLSYLTRKSAEGIDITEQVNAIVAQSGVENGVAVIEAPHSTAAVLETTHCAEVIDDICEELERIVPSRIDWIHQETPEDSAGHVKCALFGNSITAIVENGKLLSAGKIFYYLMEYDGPRHRKVHVAVLGQKKEEHTHDAQGV